MLNDHLEKLRYFHAVVVENTMLEASNQVGVSQPALSKSIKVLEEALDTNLFERHRRGVNLTDSGKILFEYTQKLFTEIPDIEKKVKFPNDLSGVLKVGTYETLGVSFWPKALLAIQNSAPHLSIKLLTSKPETHWDRLEKGLIHLVVDAEPKISEYYYSKVLYSDSFGLYAAPKLAAEFKLQKILKFSYVKRAIDTKGISIEENLKRLGIDHELAYDFDSFISVKEVIKCGLAIGVLPKALASEAVKNREIIEFKPNNSRKEFGGHRICVTTLESRRKDKRIKLIMNVLKDCLRRP